MTKTGVRADLLGAVGQIMAVFTTIITASLVLCMGGLGWYIAHVEARQEQQLAAGLLELNSSIEKLNDIRPTVGAHTTHLARHDAELSNVSLIIEPLRRASTLRAPPPSPPAVSNIRPEPAPAPSIHGNVSSQLLRSTRIWVASADGYDELVGAAAQERVGVMLLPQNAELLKSGREEITIDRRSVVCTKMRIDSADHQPIFVCPR